MLTIYAIVDAHGMKRVSTNGTGICFLGPRSYTSIVDDVLATIERCNDVEITVVLCSFFRNVGRGGCVAAVEGRGDG